MAYNFNRSLKVRHDRYDELEAKACKKQEAKYVVQLRSDAYYGELQSDDDSSTYYFTDLRTARAFANHASDICDCRVGLFRFEFLGGFYNC